MGAQVEQGDVFAWLPAHAGQGAVATQPPDASEVDMPTNLYRGWLSGVVLACLDASTGPTVFAVTDRRAGGVQLSKAVLIANAAAAVRHDLLWHRIVLRRPLGNVDLRVPTYTHLMAFGPGRPGKARPDVIEGGRLNWHNGLGPVAAWYVVDWLREVGVRTLLDPFAGRGALLLAAKAQGLDALGCDIDPDQVAHTRKLLEAA